jgi:putative iron-only hydrogenase system regulator
MDKRLGFVGIIVEDRIHAAPTVNAVLSEHAPLIVARTGLPYEKRGVSIITLIVDATTDELGGLTGRLGQIPGITVKSALSKPSGAPRAGAP